MLGELAVFIRGCFRYFAPQIREVDLPFMEGWHFRVRVNGMGAQAAGGEQDGLVCCGSGRACQPGTEGLQDVIRFNETIDHALAESVSFFSVQLEHSRNFLLGMLGHDMRPPSVRS